jgi:hypothetical protein
MHIMNYLSRFIWILPVVLLFTSCHKTSKEITRKEHSAPKAETPEVKKRSKPLYYEPFNSFSSRFHSDSLFQIKRIKFPVDGYLVNPEGIETPWDKNTWLMHRMPIQQIDTSEFKVKITEQPGVRIEEIFIEGSGFRTRRVFKQIKGKWYLTSYIDEQM